MSKIINFIFILLVISGVYFVYITLPVVNSVFKCYDLTLEEFNETEVQSRMQGWSEERLCQLRYDRLDNCQKCISSAITTFPIPNNIININQLLDKIIPKIRPNMKLLPEMIAEHDYNCQKYPKSMFDPMRFRQ